jgi:hypothetical protein
LFTNAIVCEFPGSCCIVVESAKRIESFLSLFFYEFVIIVVLLLSCVWVYGVF